MKNIRIVLVVTALAFSVSGFGQFWYTNVSYDMAVPLGNSADYISKMSFRGATFNFGRMMTDNVSIDGRFSWSTFYEARDYQTYTSDDGLISLTGNQYRYINNFPITAGATYFLNSDSDLRVYFSGGLGAYKINERTDMGIYYNEVKEWHFGLYPQVGLIYDISYSLGLNLFARYDYAFQTKNAPSHSFLVFGLGLFFEN